jgi:hypothetical protein
MIDRKLRGSNDLEVIIDRLKKLIIKQKKLIKKLKQ